MFHLIYKASVNISYFVNIIFLQKQSGPQTGQVTGEWSVFGWAMLLCGSCSGEYTYCCCCSSHVNYIVVYACTEK